MENQPAPFQEPYARLSSGDMDAVDNPIYASWRIKPNAHPAFAPSDFWIYYWIKKTGGKFYYSPPAKLYLRHGADFVPITAEEFARAIHAIKK